MKRNLFTRIKEFFIPPKRSSTRTATTGEVVPDKMLSIADIINEKFKNGEPATLSDINLYLSDMMDIPALKSAYMRFRGEFVDNMVFSIDTVETYQDAEGKPQMNLILREETFGISMTVRISCFDIHEVFTPCEL